MFRGHTNEVIIRTSDFVLLPKTSYFWKTQFTLLMSHYTAIAQKVLGWLSDLINHTLGVGRADGHARHRPRGQSPPCSRPCLGPKVIHCQWIVKMTAGAVATCDLRMRPTGKMEDCRKCISEEENAPTPNVCDHASTKHVALAKKTKETKKTFHKVT